MQDAGGGNAGAADRVRSAGRRRRHVADRAAAARAPRARSKRSRANIFADTSTHPAVAGDDEARRRARSGSSSVGATLDGIIAKRRDLPYRVRRPHRHAEDQELPQRRLRGRRLPLQRRQAGGRLAAARALRRRRPAHHVGFTSAIKTRREAGADREAGKADRAARLHRQRAGRAEPLVDRSARRNGSRSSRSSWSRSATTISPAAASATARGCCAGGRTSRRKQCTMDQVEQKKADLMKLLK